MAMRDCMKIFGPPVVTLVGTILTVIFGVHNFNKGQEQNTLLQYSLIKSKDSVDFNNKLWEKKAAVFTELSKSIGEIISTSDGDSLSKSGMISFQKLYYGEAILVEDSTVNANLVFFKNSLEDYQRHLISMQQLKPIAIGTITILSQAYQKHETATPVCRKIRFADQ